MFNPGARPRRAAALAVAAGVLVVAGAWASASATTTSNESASLVCSPVVVDYGTPITCTTTSPGMTVQWGDGAVSMPDESHTPTTVGSLSASLIDGAGAIRDTTLVTITPDLDVHCDDLSDKPMYKLVPNPDHQRGWDYAYVDAAGDRVLPGDDAYPLDPGMTQLEAVQLDVVTQTGLCRASSDAFDELGGTVDWVIETAWTEPQILPFASVTPWSTDHWLGAQPGTATARVNVDGYSASERRNVYLSGCT